MTNFERYTNVEDLLVEIGAQSTSAADEARSNFMNSGPGDPMEISGSGEFGDWKGSIPSPVLMPESRCASASVRQELLERLRPSTPGVREWPARIRRAMISDEALGMILGEELAKKVTEKKCGKCSNEECDKRKT